MKKKVLLIDGGGRGHSIGWKLVQSERLGKLYVAPGNAGTSLIAENVPVKATDIDGLLRFALKESIDLTIVGQDDPLALGIVDRFQANGLAIFGPTKAAAEIEASKVFSKRLMNSYHVPTAPFRILDSFEAAHAFIECHFNGGTKLGHCTTIVIKASGLALGKGAYVCRDPNEAKNAIDEIMVKRLYGDAGNQVVIESFVEGQEVSMHAFCDGTSFKSLPSAQDHKPIFDGDEGPNTGGMGTISPVPWFDQQEFVNEGIVRPILEALKNERRQFGGLLFPGLKISPQGPVVLEFNARFGDPETQVHMRRLKTDLLEILEACVGGRLHEIDIQWEPGFAACIVLASEGYPSPDYKRGVPITGIEDAERLPGVVVFQAGTKYDGGGQLVTSGGRVLGVTAIGGTLEEALDRAYNGVDCIRFDGMLYRTDIGAKCLQNKAVPC